MVNCKRECALSTFHVDCANADVDMAATVKRVMIFFIVVFLLLLLNMVQN
jgi:hypothetical protein